MLFPCDTMEITGKEVRIEMDRFKRIDDKIQEGYAGVLENDYPGGCDKWLEAWEEIKELFAEGVAEDIFDLNDKYKWTQFISNYAQDLEAVFITCQAFEAGCANEK